jgi:hypothetical protein
MEILLWIVLFGRDLYVIRGAHRLFKSLAATSKFWAIEGPHEQVPFRESTGIRHCLMRCVLPGYTCSQVFVRLCVTTPVLDVVRFSLVSGRGRKLVFECLSGGLLVSHGMISGYIIATNIYFYLQHWYCFYHSLDGIWWCISTYRNDYNTHYLLLLWHNYNVNKKI